MNTEKPTVSVRLEIDREIHKKVKLIQARMLLDGTETSIPQLCANLLEKGVETQIETLQIEVKN